MLSKEDAEYYYNHYINMNLKFYIQNFGSVSWKTPQELFPKESGRKIPWDKKITDNFVLESAKDKTTLGRDILKRGMYWSFFTIDDYVMLGYHRIHSLRLLNTNKEFLCISLNPGHTGGEPLKFNNDKELPNPFVTEIPTHFEKPIDSREDNYCILNNNKKIKNEYWTEIEVNTYRDLIDIIMIIPHWIKNDLHKYKINPSPIINNKEIFNDWISK